MAEDRRLGAAYWIDHYVVGTNDLDRWIDFHERVMGAKHKANGPTPPGEGRPGEFLFVSDCHYGGFNQQKPLPPSEGLGKGLPRYGHYIRRGDVDEHLRRMDEHKVRHSDPIRTSAEGEAGTVIYFEDPDENQFELWAPDVLPDGAMTDAGPLKVGRISNAVYQSRDLDRTRDFYGRYCGMDAVHSAEIASDTLVFRLLGGARVVFKQVSDLSKRTGGAALWRGLHSAFVIRDEDFLPTYQRLWGELSEWEYDGMRDGPLSVDPGSLSARTGMHGSAAGRAWKQMYGRGDQIYDWDTNSFHFAGGISDSPTMATYQPHYMDEHVDDFMKARGPN